MRSKILSVFAAATLVAACESAPNDMANTTGQGEAVAGAVAPGTAADFVANVGDSVFFEFDKSDLTADAQQTLMRQAEWLKMHSQVTVTVEGHCDERGTREYNLALGERRAEAAKAYLVSLGVDANRVKTISYGKERPFVVGNTEESHAQNRRSRSVID